MAGATETEAKCYLVLIFFLGGGGRASGLVGSQFPDQGLNPGHGNESAES